MASKKKQKSPKKSTEKLSAADNSNRQIIIVKDKNVGASKRADQNKEVQTQLSKYTVGMLKSNKRGYGIVNNGDDNLFPDYLNGLAAKSPTSRNIIDDLCNYIYGAGLKTEKPQEQALLDKVLPKKRVKDVIASKITQAAVYLELIKGEGVDEVVRINFHNAAQFRVALVEDGIPTAFIYRRSWDKSDSNNYQDKEEFEYWDFDNDGQNVGIYYWYDAADFPVYYGRPKYISGLDAIEMEIAAYKGVNHGIQNGNEPSKIIELTSTGSEEQDKKDIEAITRDTSGVANRGKLAIRMKPQGAESMTVIESGQSELAQQYNAIFELAEAGILKAWKIISPSLIAGLNTKASGFSSPAEEMEWSKRELFYKVVETEREEIEDLLSPVLKNCGISSKIFFKDREEGKQQPIMDEEQDPQKKKSQPNSNGSSELVKRIEQLLFDEDQKRGPDGKWIDENSSSSSSSKKEPTNQDYRIQHQVGWDKDYNSTLDDLTSTGVVPDDFYTHPHYYMNTKDKASQESMRAIMKAKGNPGAKMTIYRAIPAEADNRINPGDWISLSPTYAKNHAWDLEGPGRDGKVIEQTVTAKDIIWDGNDVNEFAFLPKKYQLAMQKLFDENQKRGADGKWIDEGGSSSSSKSKSNAKKTSSPITGKAKEKEDSLRDNDFETLIVYGDDGELRYSKEGEQKSVSFSDSESIDNMRAGKFNGISHNHPTGSSFSVGDLLTFERIGYNEMRAVSPEYDYTLKFGEGLSVSETIDFFNQKGKSNRIKNLHKEALNSSIVDYFVELSGVDLLSKSEKRVLLQDLSHDTMEKMTKDEWYGKYFKYERTKNG